jgi:2-keto-4-pentenoate hydratase
MDLALQRELAQLLATLRREGRQQSGLPATGLSLDLGCGRRLLQCIAPHESGWWYTPP